MATTTPESMMAAEIQRLTEKHAVDMNAHDDAAVEEILAMQIVADGLAAQIDTLLKEKAAADVEKAEWEEMVTDEMSELEASVEALTAQNGSSVEKQTALEFEVSELKSLKAEQDEHLPPPTACPSTAMGNQAAATARRSRPSRPSGQRSPQAPPRS